MEKYAVEEFGKIFVLLFKHFTTIGYKTKDLYEFSVYICREGELITYGECLYRFKNICKSDKIKDMIIDLEKHIEPIKNLRFEYGYENTKELTDKEYKINVMMLKSVLKTMQNDTTLKVASELTLISESTIKQACQQGRLLNVYKSGATWIVNLNEVAKYWNCKIKLE